MNIGPSSAEYIESYIVLHSSFQFDITAITHRNTILEATSLEYINKHHLMRTASSPQGLRDLAGRVHAQITKAFPDRCVYTLYSSNMTSLNFKIVNMRR